MYAHLSAYEIFAGILTLILKSKKVSPRAEAGGKDINIKFL